MIARKVVWFSCGAASAYLARLAVDEFGDECDVVYCDTASSEHSDNERFFSDVERWIGRPITRIRSEEYATIDDVFERRRFMSGPKGAVCTSLLKKVPREAYQRIDDVHLFGYTAEERRRADEFEERNKSLRLDWLLIDRGVTKAQCLDAIKGAGIELPAMYSLGFSHNNCPGCVKATSAGYWNLVRRTFPEIFERRARQSRAIGCRLVRIRLPGDPPSRSTPRHFLDELPPDADAPQDDIDCGPVCQMPLDFGDDQ